MINFTSDDLLASNSPKVLKTYVMEVTVFILNSVYSVIHFMYNENAMIPNCDSVALEE